MPIIDCVNPKCFIQPNTPSEDDFIQRTGRKMRASLKVAKREVIAGWNRRSGGKI
jgi:hypothetical protein